MNAEAKTVMEKSATTTLLKSKKGKVTVSKAAENDFILKTATEIENLSPTDAFAMVSKLLEEQGANDFRLGGVLSLIQENQWLEGHETFRELVESKFGIQYRKAMYLIEIYRTLVENQIPWEKVQDLGWTKLKDLTKILTPKNVDAWVKKAQKNTVLQLQELIKAEVAKQEEKDEEEEGSEAKETTKAAAITTLTFKLHEDQKVTVRAALEKAKQEVNSEFDTVALEAICVGYLGGSVAAIKTGKSLKDHMSDMKFEDVLEVFEQVFPDVEITATV